jgi:hypothetical protein
MYDTIIIYTEVAFGTCPEHLRLPLVLSRVPVTRSLVFRVVILYIVVCPFVIVSLAIVLSALDHIRDHLWHIYSVTMNKAMMANVECLLLKNVRYNYHIHSTMGFTIAFGTCPEHLRLPLVLSRVPVTRSLVFRVVILYIVVCPFVIVMLLLTYSLK